MMQEAGGKTQEAGRKRQDKPAPYIPHPASCILHLASCILLLASCAFPGSTAPVVKFGLVAPFEGRYRPVGYDALYAARLAVRERNAAGGVGGYRVELVAYDDGGDAPSAVERARQLALDSQVVAVIGHYRIETTRAAWDIYAREALPLIVPVIPADALPDSPCAGCSFPAAFRMGPSHLPFSNTPSLDDVLAGNVLTGTLFAAGAPWPKDMPDAQSFIVRYRSLSNSAEPGPYAWSTYQAAQMLFDAMTRAPGGPTRHGVGAQLAARFDAHGALSNVPLYWYRVEADGQPALQPR
jgi:ABC-type branched-subunit amino acid transport system substrate-binding protein